MAWEMLLVIMPIEGSEPMVSYKSYPTQLACETELKTVMAMATESLGAVARIDGTCKDVTKKIEESKVETASAPASITELSVDTPSSGLCDDIASGRPIATVSGEAFVSDVKSGIPDPKSQYETTEAFETRKQRKLQSFLGASPTVAVKTSIINNFAFKYDADTQELSYRGPVGFHCFNDNEKICVDLSIENVGPSTLNSYELSFASPSKTYNPYPIMKTSPERAQSIIEGDIMLNGSVDLIMVVSPEAPYLVSQSLGHNDSPSSNDKRWFHNYQLPVRIYCTAWSIGTDRLGITGKAKR